MTGISGFVGLVLRPDAATIRAAYELARATLPADGESVLEPDALPHVTLTQCPLREAPRERVVAMIERLGARLAGQSIPLGPVVASGGGFVFWCVDAESPARALLQGSHEDALGLGEGCLDPVANAGIVEATARLTGNDAGLVAHARRYGYAFVRERYLPHVTLGFDPRLAVAAGGAPAPALAVHPHMMRVEGVVLARLGRYGRVDGIVPLGA